MRFLVTGLAALFASISLATTSGAQQPDRVVVMSRDSATELILSNPQIIFQFTERGAREAAMGVAPKAGKKDWNWVDDALQGSASGIKNMRIVFEVKNVRDARYEGGVLTLNMTTRPATAPEADRRGVFKYEDVPEDQAQRFIREFRRLKTSS